MKAAMKVIEGGAGKGLTELSDQHRLMVQLDVTGRVSRKVIADTVGMDVKLVSRLLRDDPLVNEYRRGLREEVEVAAKNVRVAAETMIMEATVDFVEVLKEIAMDSAANPNARVSAARFGLQFSGMRLEGEDRRDIKTPHLAIKDGGSKGEAEKKTG